MTAKGSQPPKKPIRITNPEKTFNIVWPAIIFANNLTERLIGLVKYDITSITTNSGSIKTGTPFGTKKPKKPKPCLTNPITVTPINISIARANVTAI